MRFRTVISAAVALIAFGTGANAQFYQSGDDPASTRWEEIRTGRYRIVYPSGMDSLARSYAIAFESAAPQVAGTCGFEPNRNFRKLMPVVLHPYSVYSNGSVLWAPHNVDLYTTPSAYSSLPQLWTWQLAVHESRHVAQLQFSNYRGFRVPHGIFGQLWSGALAAVYPGQTLLEGDAVAAETELSNSGSGRNADFIEYLRACSTEGARRDFWQWSYGSQRHYTPDYYRAGYVLVSGMRSQFGCGDFTNRYFGRIFRKGLPFFNLQKTVREVSGLRFGNAFSLICDSLDAAWNRDMELRGPFMTAEPLTERPRRFESFASLAASRNGQLLFGLRDGIARSNELVRIGDDGSVGVVRKMSYNISSLKSSGDKLFWSESLPDIRWTNRSWSDIFVLDVSDGSTRRLTRHGRYFNPAPSDDGRYVAAVEYSLQGRSVLVVLDAQSGEVLSRQTAPPELELRECCWHRGKLYVVAVDSGGAGIFVCNKDGRFETVLDTRPASIKKMGSCGEGIAFTSDRNGVNELYVLDPGNASLKRLSNTANGADSFVADSLRLYYTVLKTTHRGIYSTPLDSLPLCAVDGGATAEWPSADILSAQSPATGPADIRISAPEPYSKGKHLLRIHSWAPVYFNYDNIDRLTGENYYQVAGVGVTGFFQNDLGTMIGMAGIHAPLGGSSRTGGYAKFTYSGLFPVMEAMIDINSRDAYSIDNEGKRSVIDGFQIEGSFRTYVPLNFSSGGWRRGIIPQLKLNLSNDFLPDGDTRRYSRTQLTLTTRLYALQYVPSSCIYPRFGFSLEGGWARALPIRGSDNWYVYAYGYLPGFWCTHGTRISVYRGRFEAYAALDYAMPLLPLGWSGMSPFAYLRNFELTPHFEYHWMLSAAEKAASLPAFRYGGDAVVRLENLLWIPFPTRIGVRALNTGVGFLFGISF